MTSQQIAARARWGDAPLEVRMMGHVVVVESCWEWVGGTSSTGYGRVYDGNRMAQAHRVMYEIRVGPIPDGMEIDHLCRNRRCINPDHMEPVTHRENSARGLSPSAVSRRTGLCVRGHAMTPDNIEKNGPNKVRCKTCARERRGGRA